MKQKKEDKNKKRGGRLTLLVILDGFGLANFAKKGNAITPKTAPNILGYMDKYPSTKLKAHGKAVGLANNQQGNSEAGHFNIGAGRVVEQDLVRVSNAIKDGTFFKNEAFKQGVHHAKKYKSAVHVFALLTHKNSVHTSPDHLYAVLDMLHKHQQKKVYLHLFTDGRDSSPHSAVSFLRALNKKINGNEKIATVMGRFYAMDRNKIWDRTKEAYEAIVCGHGCEAPSAEEAIERGYNRGESDEYMCPTVIKKDGKPVATIDDNDVIVFVNARSDRARQITKAFVQKDFQKRNEDAFARKKFPKNLRFIAMTDFGPDLPGILTAFPSPDVEESLAQVIDGNYKQLYISESEKYAHVTYFINGGYAEPINGEERILLKSPKIKSYKDKPEMNAKGLTDMVLGFIEKGNYDFVAVNYPNADMVGHTGDLSAAKVAVNVLDKEVKRLVDLALSKNGQVVITSDHGNAEEMINEETGEVMTQHSINPVPFIYIAKDSKEIKLKSGGKLADVAPTLLKVMNVKKSKLMTGKSLIG